jgi:hypothetical protein
MAPPRKLDDDLIDMWCEAIAVGLTPRLVCGKIGVSYTAWCEWKAKGTVDLEAGVDSVDARLVGRHARAMAERAGKWLLDIDPTRDGKWLLEHCHPDDYGARAKLELTGSDGGPVKVAHSIDLTKLSDDELTAMQALLEKAGAGS